MILAYFQLLQLCIATPVRMMDDGQEEYLGWDVHKAFGLETAHSSEMVCFYIAGEHSKICLYPKSIHSMKCALH